MRVQPTQIGFEGLRIRAHEVHHHPTITYTWGKYPGRADGYTFYEANDRSCFPLAVNDPEVARITQAIDNLRATPEGTQPPVEVPPSQPAATIQGEGVAEAQAEADPNRYIPAHPDGGFVNKVLGDAFLHEDTTIADFHGVVQQRMQTPLQGWRTVENPFFRLFGREDRDRAYGTLPALMLRATGHNPGVAEERRRRMFVEKAEQYAYYPAPKRAEPPKTEPAATSGDA